MAFIEAIALAQGLRVGAYTSPHLLHYSERVRMDGRDAQDAALVAGFDAVEAARGGTALTYFEYGTLCALWLFQQQALDLVVLEVGLGGRLDAVNLVDADAAIITHVYLDHQDWLHVYKGHGEYRASHGRPPAPAPTPNTPPHSRPWRGGSRLTARRIQPPASVLSGCPIRAQTHATALPHRNRY